MTDREDRMEEALQRILNWCEAYPIETFPKVDLEQARAKLGDDALFSRLYAEWARHIIEGISQYAKTGLGES